MELETLLRNSVVAKKCRYILSSNIKHHAASKLRRAVAADENSQKDEKREDEYFQKMYQQWKGVKAKDDSQTYKVIPKFYFKVLLVFAYLNHVRVLK